MEKKSKAPTMVIDKDRRRARRLSVIRSQWEYWLMLLIPLTFFLLIRYWPMFGLSISFQNYRIGDPFLSPDARWVGFKWFKPLPPSAPQHPDSEPAESGNLLPHGHSLRPAAE